MFWREETPHLDLATYYALEYGTATRADWRRYRREARREEMRHINAARLGRQPRLDRRPTTERLERQRNTDLRIARLRGVA